jgi:hypothetical protein
MGLLMDRAGRRWRDGGEAGEQREGCHQHKLSGLALECL